MFPSRSVAASLAFCAFAAVWGQSTPSVGRITVHADRPSVRISPYFYGLMTEEINHAYDGGLYAELIQNRSFGNETTPDHWTIVKEGQGEGAIRLEPDESRDRRLNPEGSVVRQAGGAILAKLRLDVQSASAKQRVGIANDGFWGVPVYARTSYKARLRLKASAGFGGDLQLDLRDTATGVNYASAKVRVKGTGWQTYEVTLRTGNVTPTKNAKFVVSTGSTGTLWFNFVSLTPPTMANRPYGTRVDLMKMIGEMKPTFLRLPGGNYLEGNTIAERFDWKSTLGNPMDRRGHQGPWGYQSTDGMGLLEFLEWTEDLKIEPILGVFAGYALGGQHVTGERLQRFVQDALDEIEFITGDVNTHWGAVRASLGHPKPFPLTYVEIGNEDWLDGSNTYGARFAQFYDAIRAKYPHLKLIATTPVKSRVPDLIDDHYYRSADDMARDAAHYDHISRNGPKIFVGEWASTEGSPTPTFKAALGDAAWLTGLERNSDLVELEAYAPLLVNVNQGAWQWGTNLIGYDALSSFGSPSYYVQSMFGKHTGDRVLPTDIQLNIKPPVAPIPHGAVGLGTYRTDAEYKDFEVIQDGKVVYHKDFANGIEDWMLRRGTWNVVDGALRQTGDERGSHAATGDVNWTDYTIHVRARKLGGREGFFVLFHVQDGENFWQWNVGGWDNTRTALQRVDVGNAELVGGYDDFAVQTGRWYDLKFEVKGKQLRGYVDDKLVTDGVEEPRRPIQPLYVASSRVDKSGEVIVKVVNYGADALPLDLDLQGVKRTASTAKAWVLTGDPKDVNTLENPTKVAPQAITITGVAPQFQHTFPGHSVTVIRVRAR